MSENSKHKELREILDHLNSLPIDKGARLVTEILKYLMDIVEMHGLNNTTNAVQSGSKSVEEES